MPLSTRARTRRAERVVQVIASALNALLASDNGPTPSRFFVADDTVRYASPGTKIKLIQQIVAARGLSLVHSYS